MRYERLTEADPQLSITNQHFFLKGKVTITVFSPSIQCMKSCLSFQRAITCSKLTTETQEQRCEICSKLTLKTPKQLRRFGVFTVNFEHISHLCSSVSIVNFEHVNAGWKISGFFQCLQNFS